MLPLVRAITTDVVRLSRDLIQRRQRLSSLSAHRSENHLFPQYEEEVNRTEEELERDFTQLQEYVGELRQLGVEPKSAPDGLVDFPAIVDGRLVYLCWKLGEPEVAWWHELDAGFVGRQPIAQSGSGRYVTPSGPAK